jgi:hypothetical protein
LPCEPWMPIFLFLATPTTNPEANREHRGTGTSRDDDPVNGAHAEENCAAAEEVELPPASTASAIWLAKVGESESLYDAALRCHLWLGHQVVVYVNERGVESSAQEDESWRRAMKKAIIDKIKELGSKTDSKIAEIDSKMNKLEAKIDEQNGKIDELIDEVRCVLRTMRTSSKLFTSPVFTPNTGR